MIDSSTTFTWFVRRGHVSSFRQKNGQKWSKNYLFQGYERDFYLG